MTNKKKVAIVGSVGLPANYGGFETMVYYLTKETNSNIDYTVFCQNVPKSERLQRYHNATLKYLPLKANGVQSIPYDIISIFLSWNKYDAILILGTPGCFVLPFLNLFGKSKTIVNFGGLEWQRGKWGEFGRAYLKWTEKIAIKNASVIVADNQFFCNYISDTYAKESVLIEYGGDHTKAREISNNLKLKFPFLKEDYDVSVSRAQVDNNLHMVLEAYKNLPERRLVLISNYDKFEYGRQLKETYKNIPNITLQDAVYDLNELDTIRSNAQLYIHSHSFCGTAPSLVEAMNLGLPVLTYDVPTNKSTTENNAWYFKSANELELRLRQLSSIEIKQKGKEMKEIGERRYKWSIIGKKYHQLFHA